MDPLTASRREAVTRLCQAQVDGLISVETFEDRYALVQEATSRASLEALVADLTVDGGTPIPLSGSVPAVSRREAADVVAAAAPVRLPAVFASATRAGPWLVPEEMEVLLVMGSLRLDFREALFQADTVMVDLSVTLGSCEVIVPPGTQVINDCREVFGSSSHPRPRGRPASPNGITIILQGRLLFGELKIREVAPGGPPSLAARLGLGDFS